MCKNVSFKVRKDTIQAANKNDAIRTLMQRMKEKGQTICNGGVCIVGQECKFFVVDKEVLLI